MVVSLMGCGAVGSRLALELALPDREFNLYDNDRVKAENLYTSAYTRAHIGQQKVRALAQLLSARGGKSTIDDKKFVGKGAISADLIVDCFDNAEARNHTSRYQIEYRIPVVHVGVAAGVGEVRWGPVEYKGNPGVQICTHQLGRVIIGLTVSVAVVAIEEFLSELKATNFLVNENGEVRRT